MGRGRLLVMAVLLSGCGGSYSVSPPAPPASCPSPPAAIGPGVAGSLQEGDRDATFCVRVGEELNAFLRVDSTDQAQRWSPIETSARSVLEPVPNGRMTLPLGVTAGFFRGAARGQAVLSSARPPCQPAATTGCPASQRWQATIWVTA